LIGTTQKVNITGFSNQTLIGDLVDGPIAQSPNNSGPAKKRELAQVS